MLQTSQAGFHAVEERQLTEKACVFLLVGSLLHIPWEARTLFLFLRPREHGITLSSRTGMGTGLFLHASTEQNAPRSTVWLDGRLRWAWLTWKRTKRNSVASAFPWHVVERTADGGGGKVRKRVKYISKYSNGSWLWWTLRVPAFKFQDLVSGTTRNLRAEETGCF